MSRYARDPVEISRDLLIAFECEQFDGQDPLETLRELKRGRV